MTIKNSALIMIEYQNEWLSSEGKLINLLDSELKTLTLENSKILLDKIRTIGMQVIYTTMGFSPHYKELGKTDFGLRGIIPKVKTWQGKGREIYSAFTPKEQDYVIDKKKGGSAFAATELDLFLRSNDIKKIYLAGFALHVCVLATAWAAHDLGYEVVVLSDATCAFSKEQQNFVLEHLIHHCGHVKSTSEVLFELE